eukprot:scpid76557/ scgid16285/ CGG triplet repeat-binding protein 1; 20 kDa CGG-binding protein; p20-CGGBP DNA-binding protein
MDIFCHDQRLQAHKGGAVCHCEGSVSICSSELHDYGGKLFCRLCSHGHVRKLTLASHLKSEKHLNKRKRQSLEGAPAAKHQRALVTATESATIAREERESICNDWVAVLAANTIPLSKTCARDQAHEAPEVGSKDPVHTCKAWAADAVG